MNKDEKIKKFNEFLNKKFTPGKRNQNLPAYVSVAKFYELDKYDTLSMIKSMWGHDFTKVDENSFNKAWEKFTPKTTLSEFKKENAEKASAKEKIKNLKEIEKSINKAQQEVNNEAALYARLAELDKKIDTEKWFTDHHKKYSPKSSFMLNIFDKDDIVWVSNNTAVTNIEKEMKDMLTWSNKDESLQKYTFYVINPFNDIDKRTDEKVYKFKYTLFESDILNEHEQALLLIDLINYGLPVKMITYSGHSSLHALIKLPDYIKTLSDYNEYVNDIFNIFNNIKQKMLDSNNKNASRQSRLPYGTRWNGDKVIEDTTQELKYLQEDDSKLQNDAREILHIWSDKLLGQNSNLIQEDDTSFDEIGENELLSLLKNRDYVHDIWDDGKNYHTFQKLGEYDTDGKITYTYADKKWGNERSFYSFIDDVIYDQYGLHIDLKELKGFKIRFKNAQKVPYIGNKAPIRKDTVNTFIPGWLGSVINNDSIPSELNEPLKIFINNIFGKDEVTKNWTLQWMREFMHTFDVITAPVFWEIQGSGKSMLCKAFGGAIGDMMKTPANMDDIRFNEWMNHTVIVFEECSSGTKKEGKALGDLFKDWITEKRLTIEAKGQDPKSMLINHCIIFNANISEIMPPVFIEDKDRRYTVIRNDDAVNLRELWTDEEYDKWESGEYQYILMKWIYNLPKDKSINVRTGLTNKWKKIVTDMGRSDAEKAAEKFYEDHVGMGFITSKSIQAELENNYTEYNISKNQMKVFYKILKSYGVEPTTKRVKNSINEESGLFKGWNFGK